ncbi:DUF4262 domain-containing protein [Solwaraspora sp. WMMA2065]|uniref:DUF4262 domain-containing protein n=1 Tax=Solwaraspora sp. WMMA2065 TaxID=3015166 RepID=UPI00259BA99A|nr:DUF4262 domain-containing protein [Solwaraspora sp. WMMA2065]WJK33145.1 DUF4262 domain-containing protein [Solwaraspora sp. WMMA2065]
MPHLDNVLHTQQRQIDRFGWAVTAVLPDNDGDDEHGPFAYTVGLTRHGYPELVIAGLDPCIAHAILNTAAGRVYDRAERFTHGQHVNGLIAGYDTVIVDGHATDTLHPGTAFALYGRHRVRLQQIVWPNRHGRFPWDDGYEYPTWVQPLIAHPGQP